MLFIFFKRMYKSFFKKSCLVERYVRQSFLIKKFKENDKMYGYG